MSMTLEGEKRADGASVDPSSGGRTVGAYVFIQAAVGMVQQVGHAVAELGGVPAADLVSGPYDVIARVECADVDELGNLVVQSIRAVNGVTRTLTCPVVHPA